MQWIDPRSQLPERDDQKVLFIKDKEMFLGWFRKSHELQGSGLFGATIDYDDEYFVPEEIEYWVNIPDLPEQGKREDSDLEKYIDEVSFGWIRDTLKQRCGALNTKESK